jgi:hypothetical protein
VRIADFNFREHKSLMQMTECSLSDLSSLKCRIFRAPLPAYPTYEVLCVSFEGECGIGSRSNGDVAFMSAQIAAVRKAWDPWALILDLRELTYEWGDMMSGVFSTPKIFDLLGKHEFSSPLAVVISDRNREGLTSLIREIQNADPAEVLFESLDEAVSSIERQMTPIHAASESGMLILGTW